MASIVFFTQLGQPVYTRVIKDAGHMVVFLPLASFESVGVLSSRLFDDTIIVLDLSSPRNVSEMLSHINSTAGLERIPIVVLAHWGFKHPTHLAPNIFLTIDRRGEELATALESAVLFQNENAQTNPAIQYISRSIEFPPEYYQSGVTILSYFASVLRQKNLSESVKVSIEQHGLAVRLIIETPSGHRELIERTLDTYALVVSGQVPIEDLTTNPYAVLELRSQLRTAYTQLQTQRDLLEYVNIDRATLRAQLDETNKALERVQKRSESDAEKFMAMLGTLITQNSELSRTMQRLAEQATASNNLALSEAMSSLKAMLERGVTENDKDEFIQKIQIIKSEDSTFFNKVTEVLLGSISGAGGNLIYEWIKLVIGSLPK